jgi:ribosomal protein S19E (S16A)
MARGARAEGENVPAPRLEREGLVEGGDPVHLDQGDAQSIGHAPQRILRKVPTLVLQVVQDLDQAGAVGTMTGEDPIDRLGCFYLHWFFPQAMNCS